MEPANDPLDLTDRVPPTFDGDGGGDGDAGAIPRLQIAPRDALSPLPRARAAAGTQTNVRSIPPPIPLSARRRAATAPPIPSAALPSRAPAAAALPVAVQPLAADPLPSAVQMGPPPRSIATPIRSMFDAIDATAASTRWFERPSTRALRWTAVAIAASAFVGIGYLALRGDGVRQSAAASMPIAQLASPQARVVAAPRLEVAAPVPPSAAAPPAAPPAPVHLQVPITSQPAGASITLIDDGNAVVLGKTPLDAALDPARSYDFVLALAGHPTQLRHLDPNPTHGLAVDLNRPAMAATPIPAVTNHRVAMVSHAQPAPPRVGPGTGELMVSSTPPCEIFVDGKSTRLSTPQRAMPLAAGNHKITLINARQKLVRTIDVRIAAHQATRLVQDFSKH